nr:HTTM domain-containing protein [Phytoactinopolyspora alkaliphila]
MISGGSSQFELDAKLAVIAVLLVLLVLGWRTRLLAPIILVLWVSLIESQPIYGDQSDNIFRILFFYMCFADMSGRWSLDARRRAKQTTGEWKSPIQLQVKPQLRENAARVAVLFHNLAIVAIGAQICMIYLASGLYKVQGERWQDGTGIYYPLQVSQYSPWPAINELLGASALAVMIATYFSVFIQVFFPLMLLRRSTRIIALLGVAAMHLGIAFIMGLPFFSMFIMAGDMIFIRDATYTSIQDWVRQRWHERRRRDRPGAGTPSAELEQSAAEHVVQQRERKEAVGIVRTVRTDT